MPKNYFLPNFVLETTLSMLSPFVMFDSVLTLLTSTGMLQ